MRRFHRRLHFALWIVLAPIAALTLMVAIAARTPPPLGTLDAAITEDAP